MNFLRAYDVPNWCFLLVLALSWMLSVLAHTIKQYAEYIFESMKTDEEKTNG